MFIVEFLVATAATSSRLRWFVVAVAVRERTTQLTIAPNKRKPRFSAKHIAPARYSQCGRAPVGDWMCSKCGRHQWILPAQRNATQRTPRNNTLNTIIDAATTWWCACKPTTALRACVRAAIHPHMQECRLSLLAWFFFVSLLLRCPVLHVRTSTMSCSIRGPPAQCGDSSSEKVQCLSLIHI